VLLASEKGAKPFNIFNVATGDYITVREIAALALECLGLSGARLEYTGGDRGWKGDVPVVRLNTDRIRSLGWKCAVSSREAMRSSLAAMRDHLLTTRTAVSHA
jgi:UDP-glucose 4-epimerase